MLYIGFFYYICFMKEKIDEKIAIAEGYTHLILYSLSAIMIACVMIKVLFKHIF